MGLAGKLRELRWRAAGHYTRPLGAAFLAPVAGARVLEIGGPSDRFAPDGLLPVYARAAVVDGVQWSDQTLWHGEAGAGAYRDGDRRLGELRIVEGADLAGVADGAYDVVVSSHVLEHLANPLRALRSWRRVTGDGAVLMCVPHGEGTFDHRRPVTTLAHLLDDDAAGTDEADLTHLEETLALHDHSWGTAEAATPQEWEQARRDNATTRVLHHHVFTARSVVDLLDAAGVQVLAVEVRYPHDIYVAGAFAAAPDNDRFRAPLPRSPFSLDRR